MLSICNEELVDDTVSPGKLSTCSGEEIDRRSPVENTSPKGLPRDADLDGKRRGLRPDKPCELVDSIERVRALAYVGASYQRPRACSYSVLAK